ncbi:hypothetical protein C8Q80DRAFT_783576 [Daedaleopsis nitida]|nr:hypothetical protein C8Q80DRAFT_783576 [Daedaleopsis nitida]
MMLHVTHPVRLRMTLLLVTVYPSWISKVHWNLKVVLDDPRASVRLEKNIRLRWNKHDPARSPGRQGWRACQQSFFRRSRLELGHNEPCHLLRAECLQEHPVLTRGFSQYARRHAAPLWHSTAPPESPWNFQWPRHDGAKEQRALYPGTKRPPFPPQHASHHAGSFHPAKPFITLPRTQPQALPEARNVRHGPRFLATALPGRFGLASSPLGPFPPPSGTT